MRHTSNELETRIIEVLKANGKTMDVQDIADAVQASGYAFTQKSQEPKLIVSCLLRKLALESYETFYRDDNRRYGLSEWEDEDVLIAFHEDLKKTVRSNKGASGSQDSSSSEIAAPTAVINLRKCPSYAKFKGEINNTFIKNVSKAFETFYENAKSYLACNSRITLSYIKAVIALPLLNSLGYSVFDANEVRPDFEEDGITFDYAVLNSNNDIRFMVRCVTSKADLSRDALQNYKNHPVLVIQDVTCHIFNNGTKIAVFNLFTEADLLLYIIALHKDTFKLSIIGETVFVKLLNDFLYMTVSQPSPEFITFVCKALGLSNTEKLKQVYDKALKETVNRLHSELK